MSDERWGRPAPQAQHTSEPPREVFAGWWQRVGAWVVDYLAVLPFYVVGAVGSALAEGSGTAVGLTLVVAGSLGAVAFAVWNTIFRQGRTGYSLGKQALGIRLVAVRDGQPIGAGLTFVRAVAHILDAIPLYIGFLWPIWDRKRQTFADKVMSTVVVRQEKAD